MPTGARREAMAAMAEHVRTNDVYRWVSGQLAEIAGRGAGA
jgi:trehalose-6-phosphate synthase